MSRQEGELGVSPRRAAAWPIRPSLSARADLGSRHGTLADGVRIHESTPLRDGARIGLSSVSMVFRVFEPAETDSKAA